MMQKKIFSGLSTFMFTQIGFLFPVLNATPEQINYNNTADSALITTILLSAVFVVCAVFFLVCWIKNKRKAAKLSDEKFVLSQNRDEYKFAASTAGIFTGRYNIKTKVYYDDDHMLKSLGFDEVIEDVPRRFTDTGRIASECVESFMNFYDSMSAGVKNNETLFLMKSSDESFRWYKMNSEILFDENNKPSEAIISYRDITELITKDVVYTMWLQSIESRPPESYTLFRTTLLKGSGLDYRQGSLLEINFDSFSKNFNAKTELYANAHVYEPDRMNYIETVNSVHLTKLYYRGVRRQTLEYREQKADGGLRWIKLTLETVQYTYSKEIIIFLLYENIDEVKKKELAERLKAELDPLTKVLNRDAFRSRFEQTVDGTADNTVKHTLMLIDIDSFKAVNDTFGHIVGDRALRDIANELRSSIGENDFIGRLGGDEFLVCLKNTPNLSVAEKTAVRIQAKVRKAFSPDVSISAGLGIVVYPDDGADFDTLYNKMDKALHMAKAKGKNSYVMFEQNNPVTKDDSAINLQQKHTVTSSPVRRRMLLIDDNEGEAAMLQRLFENDYYIETERSIRVSLMKINRYRSAVAAVIYSIDTQSDDDIDVLSVMQNNPETKSIPLIILSKNTERSHSLDLVRRGASEIIFKPIDSELIKLKVNFAVSKAENENARLRAAFYHNPPGNSEKYRTVFESTGTAVIEFNWMSGQFSYDTEIHNIIGGLFNDRPLWVILLSDMVADAIDVRTMQTLIHDLANDKTKTMDSMDVRLATPSRENHWFTMNAFKRTDDAGVTQKIIITFNDINKSILEDDRLRFQAEHDSLTGLLNREAFILKAEEIIKKAPGSFYMLFVFDINRFKSVNERFGRHEGDRLLKYTADKISNTAKTLSGICGRLSNDTFSYVVSNRSNLLSDTAIAMNGFFSDYPLKTRITCQCGAFPVDNTDMPVDQMIDRAIMAKDSGKGNYSIRVTLFNDEMNDKLLREREITECMESALENGEFHVYFQPQFDHSNGHLVGAEALVRWVDPKRGVFSPADFLPIFEKNGFITRMEEYVWEQVAQVYSRWMKNGNDAIPVSVNISREDIYNPQLCEKLVSITKQFNIPTSMFRIEIAESIFAEDSDILASTVEQLHTFGFLVEMDDFGSGYSSLNILKDVPVDIIKLDMRFFAGKDKFDRADTIVTSVVHMAQELSIPVIAEGVEQKEHADFLLSVGCKTIQGFLYEKPIPVDDFEKKYSKQRTRNTKSY